MRRTVRQSTGRDSEETDECERGRLYESVDGSSLQWQCGAMRALLHQRTALASGHNFS